ncbi:MAG: hypothetical protein OEZ68_02285 [Gammaproteobacteria bacterium]|nr:hypothetical protein [Gammaproteobacteria bacterium]MDH5799610.1 hypothetical protein [Gammaproteobacteria bacterium]
MPTQEQQTVTIQQGDSHSEAVLYWQQFSKQDRLKRALAALAICWLAAGVTLFIPILHFILVPSLLLTGPILFYVKFKQEDLMEKVDGVCTDSGEAVTIELESNAKLPLWTYCPACKKSIQIKNQAS